MKFMKLRTVIATVLAMTVLAVPAMGAEDPEAAQPIKPTDQHWREENQKLVALIKEKKIQEGMEKAESIMAYLKGKNLLESYQAATTYNNLGTIYLSLGAYGKSQVYLLKALKLRAEIFGNIKKGENMRSSLLISVLNIIF